MKDIFRSNSPESNFDFKFQSPPTPPQTKEKTPPPPKKEVVKKPVHPAQQPVLGRKNWNPNAPTTYPN